MPPKISKKKKKDFQKVKLKVGKKLQKSANETVPQVKVGRIQLKSQFKPGTDQPTKKRKYDITELLSQCSNCCATTRQAALSSLHCFIEEQPELLSENLSHIIRTIAAMFVDRDQDVRTKTCKLLKQILSSLDRAAEFDARSHPLLLLSLCRAMTHIQEDIQLDSLSILDIYLEYCPLLVVTGSAKLIEDFLPLISRQHQASSGAEKQGAAGVRGPQSAKGRSLLVNPNSKLASQKWRVKVLQRLTRMLSVLAEHNKVHKSKVGAVTPLYSWNTRSGTGDVDSLLGSPDKLQSSMNTLVPLLIDCWIETGITNSSTSAESSNLDKISAEIVENVLSVLQPLLHIFVESVEDPLPQIQWLNKTFRKKIIKYFMSKFPYRISVRSMKRQKQAEDNPRQSFQEKSTLVNLSICAVMSYLVESGGQTVDDVSLEWIDRIADYIVDRLSEHNHRLSRDQLHLLFRLIESLSQKHLREDRREALLRACVLVEYEPMTDTSKDWFDFFSRLCLQSFLRGGILSSPSIQEWIARLPGLLYMVGSEGHKDTVNVLTSVCLAGRQQHKEFLLQFTEHLGKYLDPCFMRNLSSDLQRQFAQTFIWLTGLDTCHFKLLATLTLDNTICSDAFRCICEALAYRLSSKQNESKSELLCQGFRTKDFMDMLVTVMVGSTKASIEALDIAQLTQLPPSSDRDTLIVCDDPHLSELDNNWIRQKNLIPFLFGILRRMSDHADVHQVMSDFVQTFLTKQRVVSLLSGCSLIMIITHLKELSRYDDDSDTSSSIVTGDLCTVISRLLRALSQAMSSVCFDRCSSNDASPTERQDTALKTGVSSTVKRVITEGLVNLFQRHPLVYEAYLDNVEELIHDGTKSRDTAKACVVTLRELMRDEDIKEISRNRWHSIKNMLLIYDSRNCVESMSTDT